jgi:hypothetical protein
MDRYLQAEMGSLPYGATIIVISAVITDSLVGALLDTVRAGHPTGLLAMGEEPPRNIPDDIQCHWIGGREAYRGLTELSLDDVLLAESEEGSACI